jgi:predicted lipid-binding transport protein (Tim44 family)
MTLTLYAPAMTGKGWHSIMTKTYRWLAILTAIVFLVPYTADARVGGGGSTGSRGSNTGAAPAPTRTAPAAAPIQRSATPTTQPSTATAQAAPAAGGGFMSRHPFMSGLMGGMLGAGLFGMMFGSGFGGGAGLFGLVFQLLLIGGIGYLAVRFFRSRMASTGASPYAYAAAAPRLMEPQMTRSSAAQLGGSAPAAGAMAITTEDYNAFESLLGGIQTAYSAGDLATLRTQVTPEMLGYFSEQLSGNASRGLENKVEAVKLEQGDLSEAWSEQGIDYATVAMRFSLVDYTRRLTDGTVVDGNPQARTEATEIWTFLRSKGGTWILSAIQQAA